MVKKSVFSLNIPYNIWIIILVVALVIVVMNRCNREGFLYNLEPPEFFELESNDINNASLENQYTPFEKNVCGPIVPGQFFFATTKFDHSCCDKISLYSSNLGCPCMCPDQLKYLNQRGGNRTEK